MAGRSQEPGLGAVPTGFKHACREQWREMRGHRLGHLAIILLRLGDALVRQRDVEAASLKQTQGTQGRAGASPHT
jgi:hypothetical protein